VAAVIARNAVLATLLVAGLAWLLVWDAAAKPGPLQEQHEGLLCTDCHVPWRGPAGEACAFCHADPDTDALRPALRFHEAGGPCLECHLAHRRGGESLVRMDHGLLHAGLTCGVCHLEPHRGAFGRDCRACHDLETWRVPGYRHPDPGDENCHRCHLLPPSHLWPTFRQEIFRIYESSTGQPAPGPEECFRCHVTHDWRHQRF